MSNILFGQEPLRTVRDELQPLLLDHWGEVAWYKDKMTLNPNWETYKELAEKGILKIYTCRASGELVGYAIFFVHPNLHYRTQKFAENDIVYVVPDYRTPAITSGLLQFAEDRLKIEGVDVITIKMKSDNTFHGLMKHQEFDMMEYNYTKYVGTQ